MATSRFRVVTDSTADLPEAWRKQYGIEVVPLRVHFGNKSYKDGVDLTNREFFEKLAAADKLPTTSAPSPGDFAEVYERLRKECDGIVSIHLGSNLSATVESARLGAQAAAGFPVEVIDTRSVTMPMAFLCQIAAQAPDLESAVAACRERLDKLAVLALLDTLRYLQMGGRIRKVEYWVGSVLDFKPIVKLEGGPIEPVDRPRTRARGLKSLLEHFRSDLPVERVGVMHAQAPADAERVREELQSELPDVPIEIGLTGAVLGTHTGPGALGLCYIRK